MAQPLQIDLPKEQRNELIDVRDHHDKPYMREKAAAVLKVAGPPEEEGQSARQVALSGLLRERRPNTVRGWVHAYKEEPTRKKESTDLSSKKAAGKSPLFPPTSEEQMRERLKELTSRSPQALGLERSRWTLGVLRKRLGEKAPETDAGTWQMLSRLGITHTRGQGYVLSPDEHFEAKRAFIDGVRMRTGTEAEADEKPKPEAPDSSEDSGNGPTESGSEEDSPTDRLFYLDELTYELHPTNSADWSPALVAGWRAADGPARNLRAENLRAEEGAFARGDGRRERKAVLPAKADLPAKAERWARETVGREKLTDLYREMAETYQGECLWVVQDNTPFHFHTDVLQALETQIWPRAHPAFEYSRPSKWPDPTEAALSHGELPVQIVPLPTYASWLNPIERLWRWLKQEVLHLHPFAGNWEKLKRGVRSFLERFTEGSGALLEYTGVSGD